MFWAASGQTLILLCGHLGKCQSVLLLYFKLLTFLKIYVSLWAHPFLSLPMTFCADPLKVKMIRNLFLVRFYFPQLILGKPRPSSSRILPQALLKVHFGLPEQILPNDLFPRFFWCFLFNNTAKNDPRCSDHICACFLRRSSNLGLFNPVKSAK